MKLFNIATLSAGLLAVSLPMSADAEVLVAGWDAFTAEPNEANSDPTVLDGFTTATMSGVSDAGQWSDWNNGFQGASNDGTFGNLSTSVASASTDVAGGTTSGDNVNLSLARQNKNGSLIFSLTNDSGVDRAFAGFYFDGSYHNSQAAQDWTLTYSGAISGTQASGSLALGDLSQVADVDRSKGIDLTGLADNVWEAGSTAIFTLTFSGGDTPTGSGGGHETLVDNIGITTINAVPEPGSLALLGLGGLLIARRRRG